MRKIAIILTLFCATIFAQDTFSDNNEKKSALVGIWGSKVDECSYRTIEFLNDGTLNNKNIKWKIKNDSLYLIFNQLDTAITYNYKISDSTLTLTDEKSVEFKKITAKEAMEASEISTAGNAASTWSKLQAAYYRKTNKYGDFNAIYFIPPNQPFFSYEGKIKDGVAFLSIKNKVKIEDCRIGNQWNILTIRDIDIKVQLPKDINCKEIMPCLSELENYYSTNNSSQNDQTPKDTMKISKSSFIDSRDNKKYKTVTIGSQTWMAENLNYNAGSSKCYDNLESNCKKYGRLYNWSTAIKSCPSGWHLPAEAEWRKLLDFAGGDSVAGKKLKAKSGWKQRDFSGKSPKAPKCKWKEKDIIYDGRTIAGMEYDKCNTDEYGFSALPGGYCHYYDLYGHFSGIDKYGHWWSASEGDGDFADHAYSILYEYDVMFNNDIKGAYGSKSPLYSVRCIKD